MLMQKIANEIMRPFRGRRRGASRVGPPHSLQRQDQLDPQQVRDAFLTQLIRKTNNFGGIKWLGNPIWQNILDLWTIQETIAEIRPELLVECGTNRGGSSLFFAHLMDLMGHGSVVTIDVERLHNLTHPRITCLIGSSTAADVVAQVRSRAATCAGPILVILDSDHREAHVAAELTAYAPLVTPGSYCLVQDGVIDTLPMMRGSPAGPLPAIDNFIAHHPEFEIDHQRCERFLVTHHPHGWLRRRTAS